jgi:hypothetical protein
MRLLSIDISDKCFFSNSTLKFQLAVCCVIVWGATWRRKYVLNYVPGRKERNAIMECRGADVPFM